jgi:hypothetical protein
MFFLLLVFTVAFALEGIGTLVSVLGITKLWGLDWIIISLAVILDFAKIVTVSFLYKEWNQCNKLLRLYASIAAIVLIFITSSGAAAFLSAKFQMSMLPTASLQVKVTSLEEEKLKLEARKIQIDQQIAQLPSENVKGRARLIANFKGETSQVNQRLVQIDEELPKVKMEFVEKNAHSSPVSEKSMYFIIGLIIFVFDPLAIALILAGNYLVEKRNKVVQEIPKQEEILEPEIKQEEILQFSLDDVEEKDNYELPPIILSLKELEETPLIEFEEEIKEEEDTKIYHSSLNDITNVRDDLDTSREVYSELRKTYEKN